MSKTARTLTILASTLSLSAAIAGCDFLGLSGPSGPGELYANVVAASGALDGAAVLELTGPTGTGAVTSDNGEVYYERDGGTVRVVIVLDDPGPITFKIRVEDVSELPSATIVQVADGNNELRSSLSDYDIEWVQLADSDRDFHRSAQ